MRVLYSKLTTEGAFYRMGEAKANSIWLKYRQLEHRKIFPPTCILRHRWRGFPGIGNRCSESKNQNDPACDGETEGHRTTAKTVQCRASRCARYRHRMNNTECRDYVGRNGEYIPTLFKSKVKAMAKQQDFWLCAVMTT